MSTRTFGAVLGLLLACTVAAAASDKAELQRTWQSAWVFVPAANETGYSRVAATELDDYLAGRERRPRAVILYAHGCDGLSGITTASGRYLARAGYVVVAPDSYARRYKPVSCKPARHAGSLHRAVLGWRQNELHFAMDKLLEMEAVHGLPLVLMGHSEGGITVATIGAMPAAVARIIEGWTCHAGWPEYRGLAAPDTQPVLALVGAADPWFALRQLHGDCGAFMEGAAQRSIVFHAPDERAQQHWLSFHAEVRDTILQFIEAALQHVDGND